MEGSVVENLRSRSRSRSNTPLPRNNPPERGTPTRNIDVEPIAEDEEIFTSPPAHRTRNALKQRTVTEEAVGASNLSTTSSTTNTVTTVTSGADPQESYEQRRNNNGDHISEEVIQNLKNYSYEFRQTTTTTSKSTTTNNSLYSPRPFSSTSFDSGNYVEYARNNYDYNRAHLSSSCSDRSNDSFAESVLADSSRISKNGLDHLPYKVYHEAVEYWNKYPKTDYTYSHLSRDRVELAPGQVAVPNMSRLSLKLYREGVPVYSGGLDEEESLALQNRSKELNKQWTSDVSSRSTEEIRRRWTSGNSLSRAHINNNRRYETDSDYDETDDYRTRTKTPIVRDQRWWITRFLIAIITTITTVTTSIKNKIFRRDNSRRYPYYSTTNRYNTYSSSSKSWTTLAQEKIKKRKWWILLLLLLLPFLLLLYTKPEYREHLTSVTLPSLPDYIVPDFSDMDLFLKGLSLSNITLPELPNITIPDISSFNLSMPDIPFITNATIMPESYYAYKSIAGEKMYDAYDYMRSSLAYVFNGVQKALNDFFEHERTVTS